VWPFRSHLPLKRLQILQQLANHQTDACVVVLKGHIHHRLLSFWPDPARCLRHHHRQRNKRIRWEQPRQTHTASTAALWQDLRYRLLPHEITTKSGRDKCTLPFNSPSEALSSNPSHCPWNNNAKTSAPERNGRSKGTPQPAHQAQSSTLARLAFLRYRKRNRTEQPWRPAPVGRRMFLVEWLCLVALLLLLSSPSQLGWLSWTLVVWTCGCCSRCCNSQRVYQY